MKIRTGFVSNSSSSSFTCDVCDHTVSGMDMCLSEAYMYECVNGHVMCDDHVDEHVKQQGIEVDFNEDSERDGDFRYELPKKYCPLCAMTYITDSDVVKYMYKVTGLTHDKIVKALQERFDGDFVNLRKYLDTNNSVS